MPRKRAKLKTPEDGIAVLSFCLNLKDPDHYDMYLHVAQRKNYSGYIVRLIDRDMRGGSAQALPIQPIVEEEFTNVEGFI